ncbi:MAG: hypothetical protein OXQ89_05550 [Rhodospirillaceae bacterium]|nr:hypothetical protein [Rhodospirillaceae bacterium]MDD9997191.1 hypothetical protein [Rhodospirillaceae bacterium]
MADREGLSGRAGLARDKARLRRLWAQTAGLHPVWRLPPAPDRLFVRHASLLRVAAKPGLVPGTDAAAAMAAVQRSASAVRRVA